MKYDEIMDRVEVTPEMRQRVLRNLEQAKTRKKKNNLLRQVMSLAACVAIVLCCWYAWKSRKQEQGVQMGSQIENVDSLKALSQKTGIPLEELTGLPFEVVRTEYVSYWTELAEIQYFGQTDSLCYRKSIGTDDNSGDYNTYAQEKTLELSSCTVTFKGNTDGYLLATWTDGTYAYSISVTSPMTEEAFRSLLEANFEKIVQ